MQNVKLFEGFTVITYQSKACTPLKGYYSCVQSDTCRRTSTYQIVSQKIKMKNICTNLHYF
uniref:Uncharacterized protein n=1 Tax=Rhizophora mucronata TaxID=61149 RepID=A0A2P2N659_RHIMU